MFSNLVLLRFCVLFLSFLPLCALGQLVDDVVKVKYDLVVADFSGEDKNTVHEFIVKGTPYLNKEYRLGKVIMGDDKPTEREALMRFNAYRDYMELYQNQKSTFLAKSENIKAVLDGKTYYYLEYIENGTSKFGYFHALNEGETVLYSKILKVIPKSDFPDHGYETFEPPAFKTVTDYYIKRRNRPAEKLRHFSRKEVFAVLWDKYSDLRSYARKNKLGVRNSEEAIQILRYYDELQKSSPEGNLEN